MKSELQIRYNVLVNHKFEKIADDYAIEFAEWLREVDTPENADQWFGYTDRDMFNEFKKEKGL